jgi:adenine-specific DNA methylase
MPTWSQDLAAEFAEDKELASEATYHAWFLKLCGVLGDPVAAKQRLAKANATKTKLANGGYGYRQAFRNSPSLSDVELLHRVLLATWGEIPTMLDPTAGGGSIPFEASRYGLPTIANDLNSVATCVLRAGVEVSAHLGGALCGDLEEWGAILVQRLQTRLAPYFLLETDQERVVGYLFARTIRCPRTRKVVPLSPNWWLCNETGKQAAVRLCIRDGEIDLDEPAFEILFGKEADASRPDEGTVAGGNAVSPWDGLAIDSDYIKSEAQAGRMGSLLYAVAIRRRVAGAKRPERTFRPPTATDRDALITAEKEIERLLPGWLSAGIVPIEEVPDGNKTREPLNYGMSHWRGMFSPRQLLVHGTFVEEFQKLVPEVRKALPADQADAVLGLLGLMQGKALNYNARQCIWDYTGRNKIAQTFSLHGFPLKFAYAEFEGSGALFPWCLSQLLDSYRGIAELLPPAARVAGASAVNLAYPVPGPVTVLRGSAANLAGIATGSQTLVCMDPPYYDNVMYGELSDFFGVWEQHTVGRIWPDLMPGGLADLKNEAVTNVARFADAGRRRKELANADYEVKMQAIFAECHRVLADDGVLTVMFTHKKAEAWDTLGMGLMEAGFTIETSWPVNTESEQSLHQAKLNSAASTIMLVCRKRAKQSAERRFFEDLEGDVRSAARDAAARFQASGIDGVDLMLATYGPALSVISEHWPVYSSEAGSDGASRLLRPDEALDAAREEVVKLRRQALIGHGVDFDPLTDFVLLAWSIFKAASFPYDEARRLALAVGGQDVEELAAAKILTKQSGTVTLTTPKERLRRRGDDKPGVHPDAETLTGPTVDAVHTVLYVAAEDGLPAAKALIDRMGLANDRRFLDCIQGLVRAIPRTKEKGRFVRAETQVLDDLVTAYFPDIELPEDEASDRLFSPLDL